MSQQKKKAVRTKRTPSAAVPTTQRLEELMEEGRRLRRIVHEQFRDARVVGEETMRFLVR
jgi:hypothetical protein